ncbi:hypothetical protein [Streptomyces sp. NRRL S-37]|uniref:hypothetical protein n=1 Tax=Streptomyces sp. NRRL S-37 TaxID=1463903 RepID=UPI0004CAFDF8|nr:hypothetical protein [Streptomyces sp. NRRL S-37]
MGAMQTGEVMGPMEAEGEGYRRVLLTHLTSWVQEATEVVTDPDRCDSASLEDALNHVNNVVYDIEMETDVGVQANVHHLVRMKVHRLWCGDG